MNCYDCVHLDGKYGTWRRCHALPEAIAGTGAAKYVRLSMNTQSCRQMNTQ